MWRTVAAAGAGGLAAILASCGEPDEAARLFEAWRVACPEQAAAVERDPIDAETWNHWRTGDLAALECYIMYERWTLAADENRHWALGPPLPREPWMEAHRQSMLFELLYFRWRSSGKGLEELEAMAAEMERQWVRQALWQHQFDRSVRRRIIFTKDLSVSPDDPGYRFLELARPDTPENTPP